MSLLIFIINNVAFMWRKKSFKNSKEYSKILNNAIVQWKNNGFKKVYSCDSI